MVEQAAVESDNLRQQLGLDRGVVAGVFDSIRDRPGEPGNPGFPGPAGSPAPAARAIPVPAAPAPAPAATAAPMPAALQLESEAMKTSAAMQTVGLPTAAPAPAPFQPDSPLSSFQMEQIQASFANQDRIIVRTVDMAVVVSDVSGSLDEVADLADELGGWVIGSDRSSTYQGFVSFRVPAQDLESAIERIRGMAVKVDFETADSQDVTDEYVDSRLRLTSLQATEATLLKLFEDAKTVQEALNVQSELAGLQADIESILGRIKFLEQTAAFSLINLSLRLAPVDMDVETGPDRTIGVGAPARFRATFKPPDGIDSFRFTWDFGDGSSTVRGNTTAPTTEPGQRVTATVNHVYEDDRDSPYIVQLEITGTGEGGAAEGSQTFIVDVKEIPTIDVFAGRRLTADENEAIEFVGTFTRPEGLTDFRFEWEFDDGTAAFAGVPAEGETEVRAIHAFEHYRGGTYDVELRVFAESDAGTVTGVSAVAVFVRESKGLVVAGWSAWDNFRTSVRALSAIAQGVGTFLIWGIILAPAWLLLVGLVYGVIRVRGHIRDRRSVAGTNLQDDRDDE